MAKAKAAKETSLPVVISLVFFVLLAIGLGVFVYVLYSDQEAKDAEVAKAKEEVKSARAAAKDNELIARAARVMVGVPDAEDLQTLQTDVKEGDKVHQEIKKWADAAKKKAPELAKAQADRFNEVVKAYAMDPNSKKLDPQVGPGEVAVWSGDFKGGQLEPPAADGTLLGLMARSRNQRDLALNQATADHEAYDAALAQLGKADAAFQAATKLFAQKTTAIPEEFKQKMAALETALNTKTGAYQQDTAKLREEIDKLTASIEDLNAQKRRLKDDVDRLKNDRDALLVKIKPPDPLQYDEPQGKVLRVNRGNAIVEIDLGSAALVNPGLTFTVLPADFPEKGRQSRLREFREADDRGVMRTKVEFVPKATIEVVEVLGPNLSRARITGEFDQVREGVLAGDLLYNSAWRKGVGEHIALIGVFDVNGDGTDDIESVERDLRRMGVNVDAVFDLRTGTWKGQLSQRTRYLVEGYQIPVGANDPHQAAKAALISKMGAAREEARTKAIQIVNFRDFFGRMGYKINPNVPEARISQAVARYFSALGTEAVPMPPKD
jgi:hypothetical protein